MLICVIVLLTSAGAAGICISAGAFDNLAWLWALPVSFAGLFLLLGGLAFGFLWAACEFAGGKPQENDSRFYRFLANLYVEALIPLVRVRIHTKGLEKTPKQGRFLLVCNHLHEADPAVLLHYFKKSQLAFISKQENKDMLIVGKIMPKLMCQLVNRENDREALKTIIKCIQLIKEDKVSIAVFPEGYIRPDRKFHQLRPGVFKIAQKAEVPIVICTVRDTHHIIPNFKKFKSTDVHLHLVEVIPASELKGKTTVEIAQHVHDIMAADLGPEYMPEDE